MLVAGIEASRSHIDPPEGQPGVQRSLLRPSGTSLSEADAPRQPWLELDDQRPRGTAPACDWELSDRQPKLLGQAIYAGRHHLSLSPRRSRWLSSRCPHC